MSLIRPQNSSIAFFQSNELVKEAEVLIIVVGRVVEYIFGIEEGMSQQLTHCPFSI
jgi:hypothetical protein